MTAAELARRITSAASGMKASRLFDRLVEAAYHGCVLATPVDQGRAKKHTKAFEDVVQDCIRCGLSRDDFGTILRDTMQAVSDADGDFLGDTAAALGTLAGDMGQFFTPLEVSRLCIALGSDRDAIETAIRTNGHVAVHEPSAGSCGMVLAFADNLRGLGHEPELRMWADAIELEPSAFRMSFVQLSLRKIPARVVLGNTLTGEIREEIYTPSVFARFIPFQEELKRWAPLFGMAA